MGGNMKAARFCSLNMRNLLINGKLYIVLSFAFALIRLYYGGLGAYLNQTGEQIQFFELFIFSVSCPVSQIILLFGVLVLISDAPFLKEETLCYLYRADRKSWLSGQICYVMGVVILYTLWILLCYTVVSRGNVSFNNDWSTPVLLAAQTHMPQTIGVSINMTFSYEIIQYGGPYALFGIALLINLLMIMALGLLFVLLRLYNLKKVSYVAVMLLWFQGFLYYQIGVPDVLWKWCPVGMSWLSCCDLGHRPQSPDVSYIIVFFVISIFLEFVWIKKALTRYEFSAQIGTGEE